MVLRKESQKFEYSVSETVPLLSDTIDIFYELEHFISIDICRKIFANK